MNLFKKNPVSIFQLVAALITVLLIMFFVLYFAQDDLRLLLEKSAEESSLVQIDASGKQIFVDYSEFGVIHVELDAPSYAQSNFDVNPSTPVILYLNGEADVQDFESKASIVEKATGETVPFTISSVLRKEDEVGDYAWKWQELWAQKVILTPISPLRESTRFNIEVHSGVFSRDGSLVTKNGFEYEFMTAAKPGLLNSNIRDVDVLNDNDDIKVFFNSPMEDAELENKLTISPNTADYAIQNHDKVMVIRNVFERGVQYTLTIPAGTKDIYGRSLEDAIVLRFIAE